MTMRSAVTAILIYYGALALTAAALNTFVQTGA